MTYNVNFGMYQAADTARAIRDANADIVCLQETTGAWERCLSGVLGGQYPHVRYRHYGAAGGMAILSKHPFREVAYTDPHAGWFPSWVVEVRTPIGPVQICNVHLRAALSENGDVSIWQYLKNPITHRLEMAEVYGVMNASRPRLVVGDFNEDDYGGAIAWLGDRGFRDALSQFDRSSETWRWSSGFMTFRDRLDHILYSSDLEPASAWVIDEGKSDHLPVVAIIRRTQPIPTGAKDQTQ
jgi:endonuclease/exonuclease/phosphatase family metal-dependent hydrolase